MLEDGRVDVMFKQRESQPQNQTDQDEERGGS